jgi:hypothetical protein
MPTELTSKDYITQRGWEKATLESCPLHPHGGCGFRRHTGYERRRPAGLFVPRWYCRKGHTTFSLVPDFAASYVGDTLPAIEAAVATYEQQRAAGFSVAAVAEQLRGDIGLQGAIRWLARRRAWVAAGLTLLVGFAPWVLAGVERTVTHARAALAVPSALVQVRKMLDQNLKWAAAPVGFARAAAVGTTPFSPLQHKTGADPPA